MIIKLKDGSVKEYSAPVTAAEITKDISMGLYRNACCVSINGKIADLRTVVESDCDFEVLTFDDEDGKKAFNHTASHVMAQAVKRLYPNAKLTIGPAIENGFYYDFDVDTHFTQDDLDKIEKEMKVIIKENYPIERFELPADEAIKLMEEKGEPYKIELIKEHSEKGEPISFYKQGEFTELRQSCARAADDGCFILQPKPAQVSAEADDDPPQPLIRDQQVGAVANYVHRRAGFLAQLQNAAQGSFIGYRGKHVCWAADLKAGMQAHRLIFLNLRPCLAQGADKLPGDRL